MNCTKIWDQYRGGDSTEVRVSAKSGLSPYVHFLLAMLLFVLVAFVPDSHATSYGANLVINGDAETNDLTNWTNSGPVFVALSPSGSGVSNSPSGGYAFDYYPGSSSGNESLSQIIDITSLAPDIAAGNVRAVLSGEVKKFYAASNCILRVQELDAANAVLHTTEIDGNTSGDVWVTTSVTVSNLNVNTRKLKVVLYAQVSTNVDDFIEFDNIRLVLSTLPTVTTTSVTAYGTDSAAMGGNVIADNGATVTARGVVYSATDATPTIGASGVTQDANGSGSGSFSKSISPLSPGTTYYVRAYAINSIGTSYGSPIAFWTLANVPAAPTINTPTATTLNVTINADGNPTGTEYAIQETGTGKFVQADGMLNASAVWQTAATWGTKTVSGLTTGTTYTFQVKARNGGSTETAYGATASAATVTPPTISQVFGATGIVLNGSVSLSFTVTNPAANSISLTGLAFTDNLPAGLVVANPNGLSGSCGGGGITAVADAGSVSLAGATLAADSSCTFSVNVTGTTLGEKSNTVQITSTEGGSGNTANSLITVLPQVFYAIPGGAAGGTCEDWAHGCELRYALADAVTGQEIWVKAGRYTPTTGTDRNVTFQLVSGVALYGGFAGSETLRSQRDIAVNVTTLSGDLLGDDGADFTNRHDNSIHVVTGANNATMDGFTVTGGAADGSAIDSVGGGMCNDNTSPTVINCIFTSNTGSIGAGMANVEASPTVTNCTFSGNLSEEGAGMVNAGASTAVTNCTFSGNTAIDDGGAMINMSGGNPMITNSTFSANTAYHGGAMLNDTVDVTMTNCTIGGNTTTDTVDAAAIENYRGSQTIRNSILWGNGGEIYNFDNTLTVTNSVVQGGFAGSGNVDADPLLAPMGSYGGATQTMPLLPGSPAIDTGSGASCATTDQRGQARVGSCDIGAFESKGFTLAKTGGDSQSTVISTSFASPLALSVTANNAGEPVNGGVVTFTAPGTGAGTDPAVNSAAIANGAVSVTATANDTAGSYNVVAGTAGATTVSFSLTNVAPMLLTINFAGNGGNKVESTSPDQNINCLKGSSSGCSAGYASGTEVTLKATADWKSIFMGWSNGVTSIENPVKFTMDAGKTVTATFDPNNKAKLIPGDTLFASIQEAYASVPSGSLTIQAQEWSFLEDLLFNNGTAVTLTGGMDTSYNPTTGYSTVKSLTVETGSVVISNVTIK